VDDQIRKLITAIFGQHADDSPIDCDQCAQHFCRLADLVRAGAPVAELLPEVQRHLDCCSECTEEFQALLTMIEAQNTAIVAQDKQGQS
jgi:hypothetical protein